MQGKLELDGQQYEVQVEEQERGLQVSVDGKSFPVFLKQSEEGYQIRVGEDVLTLGFDEAQQQLFLASGASSVTVDELALPFQFQVLRANSEDAVVSMAGGATDAGSITAFMPGTIVRVMAEEGQKVEAGDVLLILEAMKMENEVKATADGIVASVHVEAGKAVNKDELLVQLTLPDDDAEASDETES